MRRGKQHAQQRARKPRAVRLSREEKRLRRKQGLSAQKRAERRKALQPVRLTLAEFVTHESVEASSELLEDLCSFQDAYALDIVSGDAPSTNTLEDWQEFYRGFLTLGDDPALRDRAVAETIAEAKKREEVAE